MKVIQSLWTKPFGKSTNDRYNGGWLSEKYNYISWALSSLLLLRHYREIHLITDDEGSKLLIDKLQLPYTYVDTSLNELEDFPPSLWAIGKIRAYSKQLEPFLHVDGDVFLWEPLDAQLVASALFCQNLEVDASVYVSAFNILEEYDFRITDPALQKPDMIIACNAGVIGGTDTNIWTDLWDIVFEFISCNEIALRNCKHPHVLNILLEQFLVYRLASVKNIEPAVVFNSKQIKTELDLMMPSEISRALFDMRYTHLLGVSKRDRVKLTIMERIFQSLFPEKYYQILGLLN